MGLQAAGGPGVRHVSPFWQESIPAGLHFCQTVSLAKIASPWEPTNHPQVLILLSGSAGDPHRPQPEMHRNLWLVGDAYHSGGGRAHSKGEELTCRLREGDTWGDTGSGGEVELRSFLNWS